MIAGRGNEIQKLTDAFHSEVAEFIVVYGRRRIGKTYLIEQIYGRMDCYFLHVTGIKNGLMKEQLTEFSRSIGEVFYGGARIATQHSWLEAFKELTAAIQNANQDKKVVLFLDELPWLCTHKSRLIAAIEYYWNRHWKNNSRIKLVICGSSASWIIKKIVHNKGGLHNRLSCQLLLRPFTLLETQQFFDSRGITLNHQQIAQIYLFTGGVPYYLTFIKKGYSAAQSVNQLCFQKGEILYDEFDKLFESLFEHAAIYKDLIRVIASKREGASLLYISEQSQHLSNGGTLTQKLKELEDAAFVKAFVPLGHQRQGKYYRIVDEYCYFYLKWIEPAKTTLSLDFNDNQYWIHKVGTPEYYNWQGYAFEALCYKHIQWIMQALKIGGDVAIGAWRYRPKKKGSQETAGTQIDLIFDRHDGVITLCEIKYTEQTFVIDKNYAEILRNKIAVYKTQSKTKKHINMALISANGMKDNSYSNMIDYVVTLDDFFVL